MFKCSVCIYENEKEGSLSHHLAQNKDTPHRNYLLTQKDIAKKLFLEEKNILDLIKEHPEFQLTYKFLKRFWRELYTSDQIQQRGFRIIAKHHQTFNISKSELEKLYCQQNLTDEEIGKIYNTRAGNIFYLRKQYKIQTLEHWQRDYTQEMTQREKSICLGMILGDGYMPKGKGSQYAAISTHHSIIQKEYIQWLFEQLRRLIPSDSIKYKKESTHRISGKDYESYSFEACHHPIFEELYNKFYINKIKTIDREYLIKNLDALAVAIWVMDDGSCDKISASMRIYTNSFTENEVIDLINIFKTKFGINAKLIRINNKDNGKVYPIIKFNKQPAFELVKLIMPYIIPSMRYKIDPVLLKNNIDINNLSPLIINGEINISKEEWTKLNSQYSQQSIQNMLTDDMEKYHLPFPYKKITSTEWENDFNNLLKMPETELIQSGIWNPKDNYKYQLIDKYIEQNSIGLTSSDFFQQQNRFDCAHREHPSPIDIWNSKVKKDNLLKYLWTMKRTYINGDVLRGALRLRGYTASQFKPSVAKYIYNTYGNNGSILDFSAGWGDRLAGFYASNCSSYVGIDPNEKVYSSYREQISCYENHVHKNVKIINSPAEDVDLGDENFDLVFTSPPYFGLERYSNNENQSWKRYDNLENWLNKFLFTTIQNSWDHLKVNGHLIINIADVHYGKKRHFICDPMNDFITKLNGANFNGGLGMRISKRPNSKSALVSGILGEPLWIWQKTA